jgi:hypothetical protein
MNNKNIKPFYIYTDRGCLYIKNINEQTDKLANNIYSYSANIDGNENIHICGIDTHGKLNHFFNSNGHWRKKVINKVFNNIKNIKDMRLYVINNIFNIFIVEKYPISENLYRISHFNFTSNDYKVYRYTINNIYKDDEHIYKLNIDELFNIIFEYKSSNVSTRGLCENAIIFNSSSRKWITQIPLIKSPEYKIKNNSHNICNIKDDIFEYCYSMRYKL